MKKKNMKDSTLRKWLKYLAIIFVVILMVKEFKSRSSKEGFEKDNGITVIEVYFPSKEKGPSEPKTLIPEGYDFRWGKTDQTGKVFCDNSHWYPIGKGHERDFVGDTKSNCKMSFLSDGEGFTVTLYIWEENRLNRKTP